MKLLFVTGLQKSGTSLLNRLLMMQPSVTNPFLPEGKVFWGDDPPFNPEKMPCGTLFQKKHGNQGHHLGSSDFTEADQMLLNSRISQAQVRTPVLMNKNPYLAVRLPWVKKIFPQSVIIGIFRKPEANIFSLLKKYRIMESQTDPHDGWWGVKPHHWQSMLSENKTEQAIQQWNAVNQQLLDHASNLDYILEYSSLCEDPNKRLHDILKLVDSSEHEIKCPSHELQCMDNEYLIGGTLESKNKQLRQSGDFQLSDPDTLDFSGLNSDQTTHIRKQTQNIYQSLIELAKRFG